MIKLKFCLKPKDGKKLLHKEFEVEMLEVECGDTSLLLFADYDDNSVCVASSVETASLSIAGTSEKYVIVRTKDAKK